MPQSFIPEHFYGKGYRYKKRNNVLMLCMLDHLSTLVHFKVCHTNIFPSLERLCHNSKKRLIPARHAGPPIKLRAGPIRHPAA